MADEYFYCYDTGYIHTNDDIPDQMCPYCEIGQAVIKGFNAARELGVQACDTLEATKNERIKELSAELEQHRWIPVNEGLPEKPGYYLIICASEGYNEHRWWQFWYQDGWYEYNKIEDCIDDTERTVTHWKPIIVGE